MSLESLISRIFAGREGAEEKEQLHSWKQDYKDNLDGLNQLTQIWNDTENLKDYQEFDTNNAFEQFRSKTNLTQTKRITRVKYIYRFAAVGVLLLFCSIAFNTYMQRSAMNQFVASADEVFKLPDGSTINVFKGTVVEYARDFKSDRHVKLHGEGFFKVKPDVDHPFKIETNTANIEVLGTSFLVREFENYTSVAVAEGKVRVSNENSDQLLIAGDKFDIEPIEIKQSEWGKADINKVPDFIMTNGEKLENLLASVFSDSAMSYSFKGEIPDCQINAFFYKQSIDDILQEISLICGFSYLQEADIFVIE